MFYAGPSYKTACEDIVFIRVFGLLQAVCGHNYCARKFGKFLLLVLPCSAIMPVKVSIFFQTRVAVARKHFSMRIYINALAFGLFENFFQILEVMSRNNNCLPFFMTEGNFRWRRMTICAGISSVKQFHCS